MNPRIKQIALVSIALIAGSAAIMGLFQMSKTKAAAVTSATLEKRSLSKTISVTGKIESKVKYETVLNSSQKVKRLHKKEGDLVKSGETIVTLDTEDLEYQLNKAVLSRDTLVSSIANSKSQTSVDLDTALDSYNQASKTYANIKYLYDAGAASQDDFDQAENALKSAENQVKKAKLQDNKLNLTSDESDMKKQLERANLEIKNLKRKIAESTVKSSISGTLTLLEANEDQYPSPSKGKVQVIDRSKLIVKADVKQHDAVLLSPGQTASIKVKGLAKKLSGKVMRIGEVSTTSAESSDEDSEYEVEISMDSPGRDIKVGYDVNVKITIAEKSNVPAAKVQAIKSEDGKKFVFVIAGGKAAKKYVKTGFESDLYVEILQGLALGEQYIAIPQNDLKEGDRVNLGEATKQVRSY